MRDKHQELCHLLGLPDSPRPSQLKSAYRAQIKKWHPDQFHHDPRLERIAQEKTKRINEAYRFLRDYRRNRPRAPMPKSLQRRFRWRGRRSRIYTRPMKQVGFPDPDVLELPVASAYILSAGYSRAKHVLYLKYPDTEVRVFFGVPQHTFTDFLFAKSPHSYAKQHIYPHFKCRRLGGR